MMMKQLTRAALFAALALLVSTPLRADDVKAGDLVISQAWSRATPGSAKVGGGYLTITNNGSAADRLLSAASDVAEKVELHEMSMSNGVMSMRPVDGGLAIEPGKSVSLAPGGFHLMLLGLKAPLLQGKQVPVTLTFEKAGSVKVSLDVLGVGAKGPGGAAPMDHSGMKM